MRNIISSISNVEVGRKQNRGFKVGIQNERQSFTKSCFVVNRPKKINILTVRCHYLST